MSVTQCFYMTHGLPKMHDKSRSDSTGDVAQTSVFFKWGQRSRWPNVGMQHTYHRFAAELVWNVQETLPEIKLYIIHTSQKSMVKVASLWNVTLSQPWCICTSSMFYSKDVAGTITFFEWVNSFWYATYPLLKMFYCSYQIRYMWYEHTHVTVYEI